MSRPNFPKSIFEFQRQFATEEACLNFLIQSRWPDGFICPRCGNDRYYWLSTRKLLKCTECGYQTSVTASTVMHRSKMPLTTWFQAAYLVTTHKPGWMDEHGSVPWPQAAGLLHLYETACHSGEKQSKRTQQRKWRICLSVVLWKLVILDGLNEFMAPLPEHKLSPNVAVARL